MKKILFLLLLIPAFAFGQSVYTYGGKALTYGGDVVRTAVFCAEYQTVYDAYTTKPSDAVAAIWNTCVETWVANGEWATKDIIYVYAAHTNGAGEALVNWKNPGTYNATAYNAPTFTANQGFLGANTKYIDCNWIPSSNGVNFTQNSASLIIYVRTDVLSVGGHGTYNNADNKNTVIIPTYTNDRLFAGVNQQTWNYKLAPNDGDGMFVSSRTAAAVIKVYRNKVEVISETNASTGAPTHSPYCLAYNDDNVAAEFRADQVSMYAWGAGMTQTQVNNFCDPFNAAMTALGTNVY